MTLRIPALFSGIGFFLTLVFVFTMGSPWTLALFLFVAQPCFLAGFLLWLRKTTMKQEEA